MIVEIDVGNATGSIDWVVHTSPGSRLSRLSGPSGAAAGGSVGERFVLR